MKGTSLQESRLACIAVISYVGPEDVFRQTVAVIQKYDAICVLNLNTRLEA
jgi:hypothetical protein